MAFIREKVSPALLMLGNDDRRVPPSQGRRWAEILHGNGNEVTVLKYNETGHALDSFEATSDGFQAVTSFFLKYMEQ